MSDERSENGLVAWACVRRARTRASISEGALVLSAVGIEHAIEHDGVEYRLLVPEGIASRAAAELDGYRKEPPLKTPPVAIVPRDSGTAAVLGYLAVIWLLPMLQSHGALDLAWDDVGAMDAARVRAGEWWRAITALTLHADLGHIVGNSVFGAIFGLLAGRYLGSGLAWLVVVACAALANAIDGFLQTDDFRAIGASTAVFAALGVVAAVVWRRGYLRDGGWRRNFGPLFAAFALLAFTGMGGEGEHVDVMGHCVGFALGVVGGAAVATVDLDRLGRVGQVLAGLGALALVAASWLCAALAGA